MISLIIAGVIHQLSHSKKRYCRLFACGILCCFLETIAGGSDGPAVEKSVAGKFPVLKIIRLVPIEAYVIQ